MAFHGHFHGDFMEIYTHSSGFGAIRFPPEMMASDGEILFFETGEDLTI